jgi:hypothetical protein
MKNPTLLPALRKNLATIVPCLIAVFLVAGCASTSVTGRERIITGKLARPGQIWIYDFVGAAEDVPADSAVAGMYDKDAPAQTPDEITTARAVGAGMATQLAQDIREMGLPAEVAVAGMTPQVNDIVIRGYLTAIDEGSTLKRMTIGFGSGASKLQTLVEGFQMTPDGLRKIGSGRIESGGNKTPGGAVGAVTWIATANPVGFIVSSGTKAYGEMSGSSKIQGRAKQTVEEIAKQIKVRFEQEGWIP